MPTQAPSSPATPRSRFLSGQAGAGETMRNHGANETTNEADKRYGLAELLGLLGCSVCSRPHA